MNIGKIGEKIASNYLSELKYEILFKNYHSRYGEIDIICENRDYIVFVEVKSKKNTSISNLSERVNYSKKEKIVKTVCQYLSENSNKKQQRIDVIEVIILKNSNKIYHIENAFGMINFEFF